MRIPVGFSKMHLGRVKLVKITKNFLFLKKKVIKGNSHHQALKCIMQLQ